MSRLAAILEMSVAVVIWMGTVTWLSMLVSALFLTPIGFFATGVIVGFVYLVTFSFKLLTDRLDETR